MLTVFDKEKYVCVWGILQDNTKDDLARYIAAGYKIITVSNGSTRIQDCIKTVVQTAMG